MFLFIESEHFGLKGPETLVSADGLSDAKIPAGLSPRVRGNPGTPRPTRRRHGSIPACAGEPSRGGRGSTGSRVYPRVCGGTQEHLDQLDDATGLSPRVRGNRREVDVDQPAVGSIPACAGEPAAWRTGHRRSGVYPRVCGGTRADKPTMIWYSGLSPRVRGDLLYQLSNDGPGRSIPACAGEPGPGTPSLPRSPVYPRVCGGTHRGLTGRHDAIGLSPRVRGNPRPCQGQHH